MKKVKLTISEDNKYRVIKNVTTGKTTKQRAEVVLGLSRRQINRLIRRYKEFGKAGFVHGNAGRSPANKVTDQTTKHIIHLYSTKYSGFNFNHFREFLDDVEGIQISESTLRKIFKDNLVLSPKAHRDTKRRFRSALKVKERQLAILSKRDQMTLHALEDVERLKAHPSRPRMKYAGELIQMDASKEVWFGQRKSTLHLSIDDHTGIVTGGSFAKEETLRGYYEVLGQILHDYGIPAKILTDRRTVFTFNAHKKEDSPSTENPLTRFGYACKTLGTALQTTSVPEAKGRVERLIQTFQDRLRSEFRLTQITSIADANDFLVDFIRRYNERFASPIKTNMSVFEAQLSSKEIDQTLIIANERTISRGHTIAFENKKYLTLVGGEFKFLMPQTKVLVVKTLSGKLYATTDDDRVFSLFCLPRSQFRSPLFDNPKEAPIQRVRKTRVPDITHPWRRLNYLAYLDSVGVNHTAARRMADRMYPQSQH